MKNQYLLPLCLLFAFSSCSSEPEDTECVDYFEANEEIITGVWDWFPYENGDHEVEYLKEDGGSVVLTLNRSERVISNLIGPVIKCPEVSISPRLDVQIIDDLIFSLWAENVQLNQGNAEARFVLNTSYVGSPLTVKGYVDNMHDAGVTIEIDGANYSDVITFSIFLDNGEYSIVVYLQKNVGVIGYEELGALTLLKD